MATSLNEYTMLLVLLSDELRSEELRKLLFLLRKNHITGNKAEKIQNGLDLFKVLEERDAIGDGKLDVLIKMFESIGRDDLALKVKEHIGQVPRGTDVTDGGVPTPCTANSYYMQPPETSRLAYSACAPKKPSQNDSEKQPRLHSVQPVQDAQHEYRDFMMLGGYIVQILGGKHYRTPRGEFVEMKSGTHFSICVQNTHREGCNLDISIDGYDIGGWTLVGSEKLDIKRSIYDDRMFTFYRAKLAPSGSGIERGRPDNGLVTCVFTPEAHISVLVKSHGLPEPIKIEMPPYASVKDMKGEAQKRLGLTEDPEQILSKDKQILSNDQVLRSCGLEPSMVLVLLATEMELRIETSTGQTFSLTILPGRTNVIHVMEEIKGYTAVPVEDQELYHGDKRLSDRRWEALPAALIFSGDPQLFVKVPEYLEITVRSPEEDVFPVRISKSRTLKDLQRKVPLCAKAGKGTRWWFIHEGSRLNPLEDRGSLQSYGVGPGAVLVVEPEVIFISVKVKFEKEADVEVAPTGTFKDLLQKSSVHGELEKMGFILDGSRLHVKELSASLRELCVKDGSVLEIANEGSSDDESRERMRYRSQKDLGRMIAQIGVSTGNESRVSGWGKDIRIVNESLGAEKECCVVAVPQGRTVTEPDPAWRPGAVTLQGPCSQKFVPVDKSIKVDAPRKVTMTLRLVAREDEEVGPFPVEECKPLSSLLPPPVFESDD